MKYFLLLTFKNWIYYFTKYTLGKYRNDNMKEAHAFEI